MIGHVLPLSLPVQQWLMQRPQCVVRFKILASDSIERNKLRLKCVTAHSSFENISLCVGKGVCMFFCAYTLFFKTRLLDFVHTHPPFYMNKNTTLVKTNEENIYSPDK